MGQTQNTSPLHHETTYLMPRPLALSCGEVKGQKFDVSVVNIFKMSENL